MTYTARLSPEVVVSVALANLRRLRRLRHLSATEVAAALNLRPSTVTSTRRGTLPSGSTLMFSASWSRFHWFITNASFTEMQTMSSTPFCLNRGASSL